jgi:hypothetical protein
MELRHEYGSQIAPLERRFSASPAELLFQLGIMKRTNKAKAS